MYLFLHIFVIAFILYCFSYISHNFLFLDKKGICGDSLFVQIKCVQIYVPPYSRRGMVPSELTAANIVNFLGKESQYIFILPF